MRVLFVISDLGFHGAQKQVVELSRELDRGGHEVAIYTLNDDVGRKRELEGTGVVVSVEPGRHVAMARDEGEHLIGVPDQVTVGWCDGVVGEEDDPAALLARLGASAVEPGQLGHPRLLQLRSHEIECHHRRRALFREQN